MKASVLTALLGVLLMAHVASAMFGLCSTFWWMDAGCADNNDECATAGGTCYHPGVGDHGDGCLCLKESRRVSRTMWEYEILTKDHLHGKAQLSYRALKTIQLPKQNLNQ